MSEEKGGDAPERTPADESTEEKKGPATTGPVFTKSPDPLSGVRKASGEAWKNTEGKTVSLRVYIGSIVAVVVLMLLARCGGA